MHNEKIIWKGQFDNRFKDKDFAISKFLEHEQMIKELVPQKQLLIHNLGDGWKPLCTFLEKEVPNKKHPTSNQKDEFNRKWIYFLFTESL